jgi:hypothetical protein
MYHAAMPKLLSDRWNQPRLCFGTLKFPMALFLLLYGASLFAQTLEITLVDGRNGRPMVGRSSYVNVWVGRDRKEAIAIPTDRNGIARLQLTILFVRPLMWLEKLKQ